MVLAVGMLTGACAAEISGRPEVLNPPELTRAPAEIPLRVGYHLSPGVRDYSETFWGLRFDVGPRLTAEIDDHFRRTFRSVAPIYRFPPGSREAEELDLLIAVEQPKAVATRTGLFDITSKLTVRFAAHTVDGRRLAQMVEEDEVKVFMGSLNPAENVEKAQEAVRVLARSAVLKFLREFAQTEIAKSGAGLTAGARPAATQPGTPPPASEVTIQFSYPAEAARVAEERITIVGLVTAARGVQRLELVVNGRPAPLARDVRVQSTDVQNHPFSAPVQLLPGENVIAVTAVDAAGRAAQAVRRVFRDVAAGATATAKLGPGERWAVVIGIDQYRDPAIAPLRYATADAESVFRFLTTKGGVKPANVRLLLNRDATQRNIRQALGEFLREKALKDDEVIIYYAGHGTIEPDASAEGGVAKYLVPWDADPLGLFSTAIPMEEVDRVFGRLAARKILMIQDTCFSGGAGGRTFLGKSLAMRSTALTDRFLQELTQKEGRMILTASDVNQVSQEDPALGHGIFTHYLLEALDGAADLDRDGAVTVREVHLYLQRKVHERSGGAQTPQLYNVGDMVLIRK